MSREARSIRCPEGVLGWIPWYGEQGQDGRGVLSDRQRGAVEAHCAECSDCRAELDMIAGAPYEIDFELPDPNRLFDEITARIEAGEAEAPQADPVSPVIQIGRGRDLKVADYGRLAEWILDEESEAELEGSASNVITGPWGRANLWAAAAAIFLLCAGGLGGAVLSRSDAPASVYNLAAAEGVAISSAPQVDVIFQDTASAAEISESLRGLGVEIVSGPSNSGVYRLRSMDTADGSATPTGPGSTAVAAEIAARLKAAKTPLVRFAEPVP